MGTVAGTPERRNERGGGVLFPVFQSGPDFNVILQPNITRPMHRYPVVTTAASARPMHGHIVPKRLHSTSFIACRHWREHLGAAK